MYNNLFYPTASNVAVFINGYHIDQAYRFDYRESSPKIPVFGYNDYNYGRVLRGREIINGMLILNFIFSGYLYTVLEKTGSGVDQASLNNIYLNDPDRPVELNPKYVNDDAIKQKVAKDMQENMPTNIGLLNRLARAEYIANLLASSEKNKIDVEKAINDELSGRDEGESSAINSNRATLNSPLTLSRQGRPEIEMEVYFQDLDKVTWYLTFRDVYFTEVNQQMSQAGAEGSSEPLYEIYNFIAKSKKIKIISR